MNSLGLVGDEISHTLKSIEPEAVVALTEAFADRGRRWFVSGQGRSRLVASMTAMRLMHVGFDVHVTGEVTAPAIAAGDSLMMLSASGATPVSVHLAQRAADVGARVLALTTRPDSELAGVADIVVAIAADRSRQFGGSLFEQAALLLLDALVLELTEDDPTSFERMRARHTNLE
ncbi:6-phospho-3-hexuloisomerase [Rhodococcus sovatensis]|uniref:6-phospho-3-hexuloisomerase n=1 Tax=Rhodococcus sovatensis TaxID=1805840 RepID=A0ABZ2PIM1_9NOCA